MDDWKEYSRLVLSELERLDREIKTQNNKLDIIRIEIATLKTKASFWGFISGALITGIINLILDFSRKP